MTKKKSKSFYKKIVIALVVVLLLLILSYFFTMRSAMNSTGYSGYLREKQELPEMEEARQMILSKMTDEDKKVIIRYDLGYINFMDSLEKAAAENDERYVQIANEHIVETGTCEFNGKFGSWYIYIYTYTILDIPYKQFNFTCNYSSSFRTRGP